MMFTPIAYVPSRSFVSTEARDADVFHVEDGTVVEQRIGEADDNVMLGERNRDDAEGDGQEECGEESSVAHEGRAATHDTREWR